MKLAVLMPVYNREKHVGPAIRSLLRQRGAADLEIVVVDDGSTDRSRDVVLGLAAQAPCIRLIVQENQGVTRARNTALRSLSPDTDYVSFLDSDDMSPAERYAADMPLLQDRSAEFLYARVCRVDRLDDDTLGPSAEAVLETSRGIQLGAGIFRMDFLRRVGEFDETFSQGEDTDFLFRAFEMRRKAIFPDTIGVYYRQHAESLTNRTDEVRKGFLRALARSAQRRRRDPSLADLQPIFGTTQTLTAAGI
ncbi:glycosyltransferase family 2 protein [Aquibium microcysteis]|uniref:glycosyltransferase family 2 protein n=1 Tax=Aquibium microcysteis TaxID=675281 RepID=UPI00165D05FA|nr:glycosyltransferase family A protein [Aquibium microcysteis]